MVKVVVGIADTCTVYRDGEPPEGTPYISARDTEIPQETGRLLYDQAMRKFYIAHESTAPPTETERTQQDITDLQLADIERGQEVTDLQIAMMEVSK